MPSLYDLNTLKQLDDKQLLGILKNNWDNDLYIFGTIKKVSSEIPFYVMNRLKNKSFESISYPIVDFYGKNTAFIGYELPTDISEGNLVRAKIQLAPETERERHNNPLEVNVITTSIERIYELPDTAYLEDKSIDKAYVGQWAIDTFSESKIDEITRKIEESTRTIKTEKKQLELSQQGLKTDIDRLKLSIETNNQVISEQRKTIDEAEEKITCVGKDIKDSEAELNRLKEAKGDIVNNINKLNEFIEKKAKLIRELDIVDETTLAALTSTGSNTVQSSNCYSRKVDFDTVESAIAHVQAYLHNKGIMYCREVLENFFVLLRTRDLIILAGDSGSGKTNLVKSFAEAIGGKSFIIPVKPNWTGAEDLLGYYNPIEQSYLSTPFLDALLEAERNPEIPYFICLDEMNLARVEYYFADFLSLLEERDQQPKIHLYSQSESSHLISETKNFLALLDEAKRSLGKKEVASFIEILQDEELNKKLHTLCGFKDGDSLLKYHTRLRKSFSSYLNNPAEVVIPANVFFIGAINLDETTHYLSPKILDRAHIMRFINPLLQDWSEIEAQIEEYDEDFDLSKPVFFSMDDFGVRAAYPQFDVSGELEQKLVKIAKDYLIPLGVEFGLRSIRQASNYHLNYQEHFDVGLDDVLNNVIRQKILPKLMFDGTKKIHQNKDKKNVLQDFKNYLSHELEDLDIQEWRSAIHELAETLKNAETNDWVVNYWAR